MVGLSFKERIIDYCKVNSKSKCDKCVFKVPCDMANSRTTPQFFSKSELQVMESEVYHHMSKLSGQLYVMSKFMCDVSRDKLQETEELLKRWSE